MQHKSIIYLSFTIVVIINIFGLIGIVKFDKFSFLLTLILAVPFISTYLDSLNIFGNNFNFKKSIDKIENLTNKARVALQESNENKKNNNIEKYPLAFSILQSKELLSSDSTLALASLRIEIEKSLNALSDKLNLENYQAAPLNIIIKKLNKIGVLNNYHVNALREILKVCNKAIHGGNITDDEARTILDLAEKLSKSFSIGYIPNFNINKDYKEQGLICEWEHCIEFQPIKSKPDELSCKIFGHDCPGGKETCQKCDKTLNDVLNPSND